MNKRKTLSDEQIQMHPQSKQRKLDESCSSLVNGIEFMDFDDEFTSAEKQATNGGTHVNGTIKSTTNGTSKQSTEVNPNGVEDLLHGIDFDSFDESDVSQSTDFLDVSTWKRCIIDNCHRDDHTHDLIISGYEDRGKCDGARQTTDIPGKKLICRLRHFWSQCRIEVGDTISIKGFWDPKLKSYCVTNTDGLVVVRPDFLVSGTSIVGGLYCMRKAVLQDRFKGIEAGMRIVSFV